MTTGSQGFITHCDGPMTRIGSTLHRPHTPHRVLPPLRPHLPETESGLIATSTSQSRSTQQTSHKSSPQPAKKVLPTWPAGTVNTSRSYSTTKLSLSRIRPRHLVSSYTPASRTHPWTPLPGQGHPLLDEKLRPVVCASTWRLLTTRTACEPRLLPCPLDTDHYAIATEAALETIWPLQQRPRHSPAKHQRPSD